VGPGMRRFCAGIGARGSTWGTGMAVCSEIVMLLSVRQYYATIVFFFRMRMKMGRSAASMQKDAADNTCVTRRIA
jgi:hypothetical protein